MSSQYRTKLVVDLKKMGHYFRLEYNPEGQLQYQLLVDNTRFHLVEELLIEFRIPKALTVHEFCFIILWLQAEIQVYDEKNSHSGKFLRMQTELYNLNQYLLNNRITSICLSGEYEKNKASEMFIIREDINIDRLCDGIRSIFIKEFTEDKTKKTNGGQSSWKRKIMSKFKNGMLRYMDSIPALESLSLETQFYIIGYLAALAGYYKTERAFKSLKVVSKKYESYREYLVQNVRNL